MNESEKHNYNIIEASPEDASLLSSIAMEAKQYWGYPDEWMELWKEDLKVTPAMIEEHGVWKIISENTITGFTIIIKEAENYTVEHCFISPDYIGKGYGKALLNYVFNLPQYVNQPFTVLSDPHAVSFYEKFGFKTSHHIPSKPEGRTLPFMKRTPSDQ